MMVRRATTDVLSTMLAIDAEPGEACTEILPPANTEGVVSFVGVTGAEWAGTGCLRCGSGSACQLAGRFLMTEFHHVNDEVLDAFAELTNMIIGNMKNDLELLLGPTGLSIPTVIYGKNFSTRSLRREEWIIVPFRCGDDLLEVRVCLQERQSKFSVTRYGKKQEFILGR